MRDKDNQLLWVGNPNPLTRLDYPDPDVIRVGDTYYLISTTMHFMPGGEILRSYDLVHWEHAAYVYDTLDGTAAQRLSGTAHIYGKGMWAATLRYHKGLFYVCFVANDTGKTYLYTAAAIEGPWEKHYIEGFYHDCSLLFDDDDSVYIAYGNRDIWLTQLKPDLSGPLAGGLHRLAVSDAGNPQLGYEGTHFYKINGRYYLFLIHSRKEKWRRVEACFSADTITGVFTGGDVLDDDRGYCGQGVAQGGIVDTPNGDWYAVCFQDSGAVGRIPILIPVQFRDDTPNFGDNGRIPERFSVCPTRPEHTYVPLVQSDDFRGGEESSRLYGSFGLKSVWQFNHEPDLSLTEWDRQAGEWCVKTGKLCKNPTQAQNTLTQRMQYPACAAEVTVAAAGLRNGDYAGLCALQGCYGMVAITKRDGEFGVVMWNRTAADASLQAMEPDETMGEERAFVPFAGGRVRLRAEAVFTNMRDEVRFFYACDGEWQPIGVTHRLYFKMDHFTGCRFGLVCYATQALGGEARFSDFRYETAIE